MIIRSFDFFISILLIIIFIPFFLFIFLFIFIFNGRQVFFKRERIGLLGKKFFILKFRTMSNNINLSDNLRITKFGKILRKTSLDELPQLWSILYGHMSVVGPRPALFNQDDLIKLRTELMVHTLTPGLTGLAQINGRDELSIKNKVKFLSKLFLKSLIGVGETSHTTHYTKNVVVNSVYVEITSGNGTEDHSGVINS